MNEKSVKIIIENIPSQCEVPSGSTLREIAEVLGVQCEYPLLAAYVNNCIRELGYRIYTNSTIRYVDYTSFAGVRTYHRTVFLILQKAVEELFPNNKLHVRHSMGQNGFYCEVEGISRFSDEECDAISTKMNEIIGADVAIVREKLLTSEVRELYAQRGYTDKIQLLDTRPRLYSEIYWLENTMGYFYGSLAPSTGLVHLFKIKGYYRGFYVALPRRDDPSKLNTSPRQEKMFEIFQEYQRWIDLMGVPNVGALNAKVLEGDTSELIQIGEALHERELAKLADIVTFAVQKQGRRMVMISGPSSSGKTTTCKKLGIQLRILGYNPVMISLDDYFIDRELTPKDENGEYDFECLEAIDIAMFNDHLQRLLAGESVDIPRYDFITGRHTNHPIPLRLDDKSIIIIEGIHGLNPRLTPLIEESLKFKVYVSCFTTMSMDNTSRISTSDNRLLRRLTRDFMTRGTNALATLKRWESVRRGEERHIFPYQENADVMFNTSLFYEIPVLKKYVAPILRSVPNTTVEREEARRLLKFLDHFVDIPDEEIPKTSLLREFIGGSSFRY
ncbi:MAG: nucleoside kinase [Rikenellaceae bacterium]